MSEQAQRPSDLSHIDLQSMVMRLGSTDPGARAEAELRLKRAGIEALEPLVAAHRREVDALRKRQRRGLGLAALLIAACAVVVTYLPEQSEASWLPGFGFFMLLIASGLILLSVFMQPSLLQQQTASLLMGIADLRAIGPLIDLLAALDASEQVQRQQLSSLLIPLLKRLRASDTALLAERHRAHFRHVLKRWDAYAYGPSYQTEYLLAILKALQQAGDPRDLPFVERIAVADQPFHETKTGWDWLRENFKTSMDELTGRRRHRPNRSRIVQAAQECLPFLQAKEAQYQASHSLLRASGIGEVAPEALLRSAAGEGEIEQHTLLRSMDRTGQETG